MAELTDIAKITLPNGNEYNFKDTTARTPATISSDGAMSAADKRKLNDLSNTVENYKLPTASETTLGGFMIGQNLTMSNGVLSGTPDTVTQFDVNQTTLKISTK